VRKTEGIFIEWEHEQEHEQAFYLTALLQDVIK